MGASEVRAWARHCGNGRAAARAYAIANALDGLERAEAARLAGIKRQALRDAVIRYNAEGVDGLLDRPKGRRAERLTEPGQCRCRPIRPSATPSNEYGSTGASASSRSSSGPTGAPSSQPAATPGMPSPPMPPGS
ncbi:MAG: helix-turn-helix domain-containing protein [Rhodospirillaceae bacterium]